MLKKQNIAITFLLPQCKLFFKGRANQDFDPSIKSNPPLLAQSNQKLSIRFNNNPLNGHLNRVLTESMNISKIKCLSSTTPNSGRKSPSNKKRRIITDGSFSINKKNDKLESSSKYNKKGIQNISASYLGHYNIFDYIERTNEEMVNKKRAIQSFKEKNKMKKVNYALISNVNKQKYSLSPQQWNHQNSKSYKIIGDMPRQFYETTIKDTNTPIEKRVRSGKCKPTLFITNIEIMNKLIEENNTEERATNVEEELKKEFVRILSHTHNSHRTNYFKKMEKQLKKDIWKNAFQVKDTMDDLRRLQHNNDDKLTKKAFILKDIY